MIVFNRPSCPGFYVVYLLAGAIAEYPIYISSNGRENKIKSNSSAGLYILVLSVEINTSTYNTESLFVFPILNFC